MAAFLASKVGAERIKYMRLMKLMYMADRESMARFGEPISYDDMFSMNHGLVLSKTLNVVSGVNAINDTAPWSDYFSPRNGKQDYFVGVNRLVERDELDFLSDADIEVLNATFDKFGHMSEWDLSQYMHDHCAEWKHPDGSRIPVDDEGLLKIVGVPEHEAALVADELKAERQKNKIFKHR